MKLYGVWREVSRGVPAASADVAQIELLGSLERGYMRQVDVLVKPPRKAKGSARSAQYMKPDCGLTGMIHALLQIFALDSPVGRANEGQTSPGAPLDEPEVGVEASCIASHIRELHRMQQHIHESMSAHCSHHRLCVFNAYVYAYKLQARGRAARAHQGNEANPTQLHRRRPFSG